MKEESQENDSAKLGGAGGVLFLVIMSLGYAVYAADRTVLSSMLKPMSAALGLSDLQIGLLSSAQYIGVLAFVFVAGHLSDKYGTRRIILVGVSVFTASTWLIGFSTSFYEAFAFRLVSGLGEGLFWPVAMSAVAKYFGVRKGLALGIFYAGFDAGSATGLSIGGAMFSLTTDWRYAFFVAPLIGIAVVAGVFVAKDTFARADGKVGAIALGRDALDLLKRKDIRAVMLFALLATWASVWQVVYLPYYFSKVLGLSVPLAAFVSTAVTISGGFGKVLLGGASDRWRRNRMLAVTSAVVILLYAVFFTASDFYVSVAAALTMGFFSSSIFPVMQALMCDSCDGKTGTALGLTTTAQSVPAVFSTTITAYLFSLGVGKAIALDAMIPALLMLVVALFLKDPRGVKGA
ncbi:MAG: MFS transporter [Nitrososphaerales archaeon]